VTKQWTAKWPYNANAVSRIVQNHGEKSYFRRLSEGAIVPITPWVRPCQETCGLNLKKLKILENDLALPTNMQLTCSAEQLNTSRACLLSYPLLCHILFGLDAYVMTKDTLGTVFYSSGSILVPMYIVAKAKFV